MADMDMAPRQLELRFSASNLLNTDLFSLSDPFLVLHTTTTSNTSMTFIARTESVTDDLNPRWATAVSFDYPTAQHDVSLVLDVFDRDCSDMTDLTRHDFLGRSIVSLRALADSPSMSLSVTLGPASTSKQQEKERDKDVEASISSVSDEEEEEEKEKKVVATRFISDLEVQFGLQPYTVGTGISQPAEYDDEEEEEEEEDKQVQVYRSQGETGEARMKQSQTHRQKQHSRHPHERHRHRHRHRREPRPPLPPAASSSLAQFFGLSPPSSSITSTSTSSTSTSTSSSSSSVAQDPSSSLSYFSATVKPLPLPLSNPLPLPARKRITSAMSYDDDDVLTRATRPCRRRSRPQGTLTIHGEFIAPRSFTPSFVRLSVSAAALRCGRRRVVQFYEVQRAATGGNGEWNCVYRSEDGVSNGAYVSFRDVHVRTSCLQYPVEEEKEDSSNVERALRVALYRRHIRSKHELIAYAGTTLAFVRRATRIAKQGQNNSEERGAGVSVSVMDINGRDTVGTVDGEVAVKMEGAYGDEDALGNVVFTRRTTTSTSTKTTENKDKQVVSPFSTPGSSGASASQQVQVEEEEEEWYEVRADHFLNKRFTSALNDARTRRPRHSFVTFP